MSNSHPTDADTDTDPQQATSTESDPDAGRATPTEPTPATDRTPASRESVAFRATGELEVTYTVSDELEGPDPTAQPHAASLNEAGYLTIEYHVPGDSGLLSAVVNPDSQEVLVSGSPQLSVADLTAVTEHTVRVWRTLMHDTTTTFTYTPVAIETPDGTRLTTEQRDTTIDA